ncbi:sensor histidine kinase [Saccharothrix algeriensis]|uniref:histidine kinase n=1 Tax=Saccharothrix algeriensis TaxID=173560 RepID=A0A8T8HYU0_9PSEU|nr:sensor histidine kinase [Saccharothrix algeriensis]MBM7814628.1 signal transduction histidine kinase [Saccharothrix algeriensis]QTR02914.1 sensor histidine kinase [Saccharothrix algeriensis]
MRPVAWLSPLLYGAVLLAGGYAGLAGLGETRFGWFAGGLVALVALDLAEPRFSAAGVFLVARAALVVLVAAADGSGMARVLLLLLPFGAYFAFGRVVAVALGLGCAGLVVVSFSVTAPGWAHDVERVSDLLMFAVGLVVTLAVAAVAVEERRGRARLAELSAAAERSRVARDIHDGLGHHLTAVSVLLEKASAFRERDPEAADRALADARESARRALEDVRRSVGALREPFRLAAALAESTRGLKVDVRCGGDEDGFDPAVLLAVYRAAQEGVTNALRHADAGSVSVRVHCGPEAAELVVLDDGRGFSAAQEGFGLSGMRERVAALGGEVDVRGAPGAGTRLTVRIPR